MNNCTKNQVSKTRRYGNFWGTLSRVLKLAAQDLVAAILELRNADNEMIKIRYDVSIYHKHRLRKILRTNILRQNTWHDMALARRGNGLGFFKLGIGIW